MTLETVQQAATAAGAASSGVLGLGPILTTLVGVVVAATLYEYWHRNSREYRMVSNIPSPPGLPLLGQAHLAAGLSNAEIMSVGMGYLNKYGETVKAWLGHVLLVFLTNPNDIELILSGHQHLTKAEEYRYFKPWFGDGLLISNGHHWRHHRKMIAPTFHQSILKSFVPTFVDHSKNVVARMDTEAGKSFDVHDYMSQTTVDILLSTAMGVKKLPEGNKSFEYAQAVVDMCDIIHKRQIKLLYRLDSIYKFTKLREKGDKMMNIILGMTSKVVKDRKENFQADTRAIIEEELTKPAATSPSAKKEGLRDDLDDIDENDVGAKRRLALLDAMVEMAKNPDIEWNEKDIIDEVNTIMFEGHDTTSAGSSFALCMMGIHKHIQERVFAEQKAIFGDNMQRDCTFADAMEMKYLERVILETLRLYPPVPLIARRLDHDLKLASGPYTVPKGTTVIVLQYCVHRRPDIYPNPTTFDPDNFLPERMANRHYYAFIPFSAGPRSCVGRKYAMLKLKVLLSTIVRNYIIHSTDTEADFKLQADIILKLENGFNISLEKRKYPTVA
ncbi:cytochrome P450 4g1 [Drosophila willistoni]|uniref:cytochrome P450 4g1 n=1 Tax=Drosophila willistoni TaxID=7260 RepID=UPI001F072532|nr:cytochrome P450 4g1 [Drosophila willistoni]